LGRVNNEKVRGGLNAPSPGFLGYWLGLKDRDDVETGQRTRVEEGGGWRNAFPALPIYKTGAR
jgi:hypothetical protein